jgi:hypothetical protein
LSVSRPITAPESVTVSRAPGQTALDLIKLAYGLKASSVTRKAANNSDMMAFWPSDNQPTRIVTCVEASNDVVGTHPSGQPKLTPSVQTVNLATGEVATILRGMIACDRVCRTPWNTIVVTEEVDDGGLYEILNPLTAPDLTLVARGASDVIDTNGAAVAPGKIEYRGAVGKLAWEGLELIQQGVVYYSDEERPGTGGPDFDGGSLFKYVPELPWAGTPVTDLSLSPLVSGTVYAYQASCQGKASSSFPQVGQGCEIGDGEVICTTDANPLGTGEKTVATTGLTYLADSAEAKGFAVATANRVLEGDPGLNQPVTGNMYVIEDNPFGDVWACLPDGKDRDIKVDGCVKLLSVRDSSAEPTGYAFTGDGKTAYVHIQHSNDSACIDGTDCGKNDDYFTDDLIKVTGFKIKQ